MYFKQSWNLKQDSQDKVKGLPKKSTWKRCSFLVTYVGWWYVHEVSRKLRIENEVQNRVFCFLHIIFFSNFKSCNMLPLRFLSRNTQENLFSFIKKPSKICCFNHNLTKVWTDFENRTKPTKLMNKPQPIFHTKRIYRLLMLYS